MKIMTAETRGQWLAVEGEAANGEQDLADKEARRIVSDLFRCNNLVVLAGLGTSLCLVDAAGKRLAPTMADLWARVKTAHEKASPLTWSDMLNLVRHTTQDENLEALLSRCRLAEAFLDGDNLKHIQNFIALAEGEIYDAVNFLRPGQELPAHSEFLRRAARRSNRKCRTKIFTTNYDRCYEEAGRQGRFVVIDGFSHTMPPTFDAVHFTYDIVWRARDSDTQDFIPNVFHLYKLHGSIDWERNEESGEIHKVADKPKKPLLIYPRNSKYELAFEQPYLEMIAAMQAALREPNTGLLVVGFGFNDNHLAEPILSAIRSNLSLKVAVVSPGLAPSVAQGGEQRPGEAKSNRYLQRLQQLIEHGDARLGLLNCSFDKLVEYIPDIAAESDLERHFERVRKLEQPKAGAEK